MITSFSHIYYRVRDIDESIEWYTRHLDFKLLRKYSINGRVSCYLELGGVLLELTKAASEDELPGPNGERRLGLTTPDMDATLAKLQAAGVTVINEPFDARTFWGRQCVIRDINGYWISLREWQPPDGPTYPDWQPRHEGVVRLA